MTLRERARIIRRMSRPDIDLVLRTARLARLEIDAGELEALSAQFARILEALQVIAGLDPSELEPLSPQGSEVLRDDRPRPSLAREALLSNAPAREGDFFRVPKTVGGEP